MRERAIHGLLSPWQEHVCSPLPQGDRLNGKCVYFARVNPRGVSEKTLESDLVAGDISGPDALDAVRALVADVYLPLLQVQR